MIREAAYWIEHLNLAPHPEGGFYRETYRAAEYIPAKALPARFDGDRSFSTGIYFLLRAEDRSRLHRIQSDEMWHFYAGTSLSVYVLHNGELSIHVLGQDLAQGEQLQVVVPAGAWFGARVNTTGYVLAGCTVAPGFDFADFEMADHTLLQNFPQHANLLHPLL